MTSLRRSTHHFVNKKTNENFVIEVEIDMDILAHDLARRVLNTKLRKTRLANGAVKAKVVAHEDT